MENNAWFVNFNGIGNGIIIAPILTCFEKSNPTTKYFHTANEVLENPWYILKAQLKNLVGFSPLEWRRFDKTDYERINSFIKQKNIGLIINVRNEGQKYDMGYYIFKDLHSSNEKLRFLDLDFTSIEKRALPTNLTTDIIELLQTNGVDFSKYNHNWLSCLCKPDLKRNVGFGMAASQSNKRWPVKKWIELGELILKTSDSNIFLFGGNTEIEKDEAKSVFNAIGGNYCRLVTEPLEKVSEMIGSLKCFFSNDTGLLHISVAIGTPTIGIYTSTNPNVWSPLNKEKFTPFENSFMKLCPDIKTHGGNCFHYYDTCPAIRNYGDDICPNAVYNSFVAIK